jgi:hypothetical protein
MVLWRRRVAACWLLLAQQRTREQPTMPVMKMARLKLKMAKTSIAAAQHFMSLSAATLMVMGSGWSSAVSRAVEHAD